MSIERQIAAYCRRVELASIPKPAVCRNCGRAGRLRWHGSYRRSILTLAEAYVITVKRIFCALCRSTFSLLPSFARRFHRYAVETIRYALKQLGRRTYEQVAELFVGQDEHRLGPLTLHFWRRRFA